MAGTIEVGPDSRWSAASWLFDWVLRSIALEVNDAELAGELVGIVDENIGWLSLDELSQTQQKAVRAVIQDGDFAHRTVSRATQLKDPGATEAYVRGLVDLMAAAAP